MLGILRCVVAYALGWWRWRSLPQAPATRVAAPGLHGSAQDDKTHLLAVCDFHLFRFCFRISCKSKEVIVKFSALRRVSASVNAVALLLSTICFIGDHAFGQSAVACHAMETRDQIAPEKLPPPEKLTGIGNSHIHITSTAEAQMWFDQGLNLLHDFWDYESARAFEQSIRVDPQCAM